MPGILPLRCATCYRVRYEPTQPWQDHPGQLPGEVSGICRTCTDIAAQKARYRWIAQGKRLLRDRKRAGMGADIADPFAGFREH